jgi:DNA-binding transcriptional MerR regulator
MKSLGKIAGMLDEYSQVFNNEEYLPVKEIGLSLDEIKALVSIERLATNNPYLLSKLGTELAVQELEQTLKSITKFAEFYEYYPNFIFKNDIEYTLKEIKEKITEIEKSLEHKE